MQNITVAKNDHNGEIVLTYDGEVVERGETWVKLRAIFQYDNVNVDGLMTFRRGDVFTEWFYSDRWYNVFMIEAADDGHLRGWYCNVTRPATIADGRVGADDLALDVVVLPDGDIHVLDEDEFAALPLTDAEREHAQAAVERIKALVEERTPPFDRLPQT